MSPRGRGSSSFRGGRGDLTDRSFNRGRDTRERDHEYPARRSPPPRYRARDDYRPHHRERSRSPPGRYRPRTRSPPPVEELPRRDPREVPEVQAIVTDELDRFVILLLNVSLLRPADKYITPQDTSSGGSRRRLRNVDLALTLSS